MMAKSSGSDKSIRVLVGLAKELESFARSAAGAGTSQYEAEKGILSRVLRLGAAAMDLFLRSQGDGDLGETVETESGERLYRSREPVVRPLRTIFGEHQIAAYVYSTGAKAKVALRPIDVRLNLPPGKHSYLFEEFAEYFCVEEAFAIARERMACVFGSACSVDSLERISRRMGEQADAFLEALPQPPPEQEKELLVVTADAKGVPLVTKDMPKTPAFEKRERPGNRRMATLASVYSVDRHVRTAEQILAALFREESSAPPEPRPAPAFKQLIARFTCVYEDGSKRVEVPGAIEAFAWARQQVEQRHQPGQPIVRLLDGQPSLQEAGKTCLDDLPGARIVDILDIVHVAGYVWRAAKALEKTHKHREDFVRDRLGRILRGQVRRVVSGLRQMASKRRLAAADRKEIDAVCAYFANNAERMRYDVYLAAGFPIATGVIEGACRHLVKDRLERSGMRWTLQGAQAMLNVRAVLASSYWSEFNRRRMADEQASLHPNRRLLANYRPPPTAI